MPVKKITLPFDPLRNSFDDEVIFLLFIKNQLLDKIIK